MKYLIRLFIFFIILFELSTLKLISQDLLIQRICQKYNISGVCLTEQFQCTNNPLCQIYPNQNMCKLMAEIPNELRNLSYVIYPTDVDRYNTARFIFNKRFNIFPHAIIKPINISQLQFALQILKKYNLDFSLQSGGHSFESGPLSSGYIIDLDNFINVSIDIAKEEIFIGAGCRLGGVIQLLGNLDYALPLGTCASNGITGLALGGGVGYLTRQYGLTCDVIKNIILLNAEGEIITVDANHFSDLFWALRGAGAGSFGIVIGFTFKIFYVPKVSLLTLKWDWDPSIIPDIIHAWQSWITNLPNSITTELDLNYLNGDRNIVIRALKVGSAAFTEWQSAFMTLQPNVSLKQMRYIDSAKLLDGTSTFSFVKAKSKMLFAPLTDPAIQIMINYFNELKIQNKNYSSQLALTSAGGQSALADTAYFPRNALAWFYQFIYWNDQNDEDNAIASITKFYDEIEPFCSPYSYTNLTDFDLGNTYLNAYYGDHVARLIAIKTKYDPLNIFHWQQSIPVMP